MADDRNEDRQIAAAMQAATMASIQVLVRCLESSGALQRGDYANALLTFMEAAKNDPQSSDVMLALMHELRAALLD